MADSRQQKAVATANAYDQGNIAGLSDAMTRRLVASTVLTESHGGDLAVTNRQGYTGRYQAGAGWLAEAGYIDAKKLNSAMVAAGFDPQKVKGAEWKWASSGGMSRFMEDPANWNHGLSLDRYKASADLQDRAFKIVCDKSYAQALKSGVLDEDSSQGMVAGFLKARHISGFGGAKSAALGGRVIRDANGTSNYDYMHDVSRNRDGLDALMPEAKHHRGLRAVGLEDLTTARPISVSSQSERHVQSAGANTQIPNAMSDGMLRMGERGAAVAEVQQTLAKLDYLGKDGKPLPATGNYLENTKHAVESFQRAHGLTVDGIADPKTLQALKAADRQPLITNDNHPDNKLFDQIKAKCDAQGGAATLGLGSEREYKQALATMTYEAKVAGMTSVDHVVPSTNGQTMILMQVNPANGDQLRAVVDKQQAMQQPVEQSTFQLQQDQQRVQQLQQQGGEQQQPSQRQSTMAM